MRHQNALRCSAVLILAAVACTPLSGWSQTARPAVKSPVAAEVQPDASYEIGLGDVLGINVWREPEVSQKLVVRPDGMISLPLVGDVPASGRTPQTLSTEITDKLKAFIAEPHVTVIVIEVRSKWYVVTGEVTKPGQYPVTRSLRVLQALSAAGGFREFAKTKKIYVLHRDGNKTVRLPFNYNNVVKGKNVSENIEVHDGDTIVVP
jgi:polysaccharide biosynthesis/export protein